MHEQGWSVPALTLKMKEGAFEMAEKQKKGRGPVPPNHDFPRILTLLRKERGYSQKKAAEDLHVSQALLSHYEKGIRKCGLEFVLRVADYYDVSCDYLLGRTPQRTGAVLSLPQQEGDEESRSEETSGIWEYDRRILENSIHIVFSILEKINSESLKEEMCIYLYAGVYKSFRLLYSSNPKNPMGIFSLNPGLTDATMGSLLSMAEARSRYVLSGENIGSRQGVPKENIPSLTPETLLQNYPDLAPSLFDLIKRIEKEAKSG